MGRRGPLPTPTPILSARGSRRANARTGEPTLPVGVPPCPLDLGEVGKREWRRLTKLLREMGVLTKADGYLLAALCQAWSEYVEATAELRKGKPVVTGS